MTELLYVGNLPKSATDRDLLEKFGRFGTVNSAVIMTDAIAGRRRFGLVEMSSYSEAQVAINRLNMTQFDDTVISVNFSRVDQHGRVTEE